MTRLLISTIRRNIPHTEPSGYIYVFNLEKQFVIQRSSMIEPAFRELDNNPRGGMRGSRGIAVGGEHLAISNASMVYLYDPHWNLLNVITHPSMAAIHDIAFHGDTIWITAARNDMVFQFNLDGRMLRHLYIRDLAPILYSIDWHPPRLLHPDDVPRGTVDFRDPRSHKEETYDRAHVNSVSTTEEGDILISLGLLVGVKFAALLRLKNLMLKHGLWHKGLAINRLIRDFWGIPRNIHSDLVVRPVKGHSAIIRLSPVGNCEIISILPNMIVPSHSLLRLRDQTLIYLNTTEGHVMHYNMNNSSLISSTHVSDGFLRGATQLQNHDHILLLGSKGGVIIFDLETQTVLSSLCISQDPDESVYDIKILPDHFGLPPVSFFEHLQQTTGIRGSEDIISLIDRRTEKG